jgi:predicted dehydrogenase
VRVSVIGCGYWGKNLVRNFQALGALGQICDVTESGRALAAELAPGVPVADDPQAALDSDADGVVIATPAETHAGLIHRALEAGKDVFVEKPMALTAEEGAGLVAASERTGKILMVGHLLEYHPAILRMVEMVRGGELGALRAVVSSRISFGKVSRDVNVLWSFAPHDVAVVLRLLGSLPSAVSATGAAWVRPGLADVVSVGLSYADGRYAQIHTSWLHPKKEQRLVVIGESRTATYDDVTKEFLVYDNQVEVDANDQSVLRKGECRAVEVAGDEPLRLECQAFLTAIETRTPPITDAPSGQRVLTVLQAAQDSLAWGGAPVEIG